MPAAVKGTLPERPEDTACGRAKAAADGDPSGWHPTPETAMATVSSARSGRRSVGEIPRERPTDSPEPP